MLLVEMPNWASSEIWLSLMTLTFLEIILGIDNIIFISIASSKLPSHEQGKATNIGLFLAMFIRILLLFGISVLIALNEPWLTLDFEWIEAGFSGQSLILIAGGIFLLYKSVSEIHYKLEDSKISNNMKSGVKSRLIQAVIQITIINVIFSFDSILTAVGMTNGIQGSFLIMIIAIVMSVIIMMLFATAVGRFVHKHPTIQMLGLSFLILIGFMLILEGSHLAHLEIAGEKIGSIPKGYLYFAISFSLGVEFLNIRLRKNPSPVKLHGIQEEALEEGITPK